MTDRKSFESSTKVYQLFFSLNYSYEEFNQSDITMA